MTTEAVKPTEQVESTEQQVEEKTEDKENAAGSNTDTDSDDDIPDLEEHDPAAAAAHSQVSKP